MKFISVVFFTAALIGTWHLVHEPRPVAESVHAGIQNDLRNIIADYIRQNRPGTEDVHFESLWTETISDRQVKAHFRYWFDDRDQESGESAAVHIEGSAVLNKVDENEEVVTWSFDELSIADTKITFETPIQITARPGAPLIEEADQTDVQ